MSWDEYIKHPKIKFINVAKDFDVELLYFKQINNGLKLKVGEVTSVHPGKYVLYIVWYAKYNPKINAYKFYQGGSPFNTYYHKLPLRIIR